MIYILKLGYGVLFTLRSSFPLRQRLPAQSLRIFNLQIAYFWTLRRRFLSYGFTEKGIINNDGVDTRVFRVSVTSEKIKASDMADISRKQPNKHRNKDFTFENQQGPKQGLNKKNFSPFS